MERKIYLNRYRLSVDRLGLPFIIRRSADEAMFQAEDTKSGGQVALQVMSAAALGTADREQLIAEARAAQEINHVNIPQLSDFGFENDQLIYVTESLEGTSAEEWIRARGPMPASAVLRIAAQVVSALVAASLHGIVHYGVHPGNILLAPGETAAGEWPLIKLVNLLGVVPTVPWSGLTSASLNLADFASPEQLQDRPVNFRSEIYSLGCTLWFLLKGVSLLGGAEALPEANGLSEPVRQLLAGMLAKNPAERPSDPVAIQLQIQNCLGQLERPDEAPKFGVISTPVAPPLQSNSSPRRSAWRPLALAAVLLALAALAAVILKQRESQIFTGAATAAAALSTGPVLPPGGFAKNAEASPRQEATKPPTLAFNVGTRTEETERATPAPDATKRAMVSSEQAESTPAVVAEERNSELSQPIAASNSIWPDPRIVAMEPTPLPFTLRPSPPAEGPAEKEQASLENIPPQSETVAQEETPKNVPAVSPKVEGEKNSKAKTTAKSAKKKAPAETLARSRQEADSNWPRPQSGVVVVGHIFPPAPR